MRHPHLNTRDVGPMSKRRQGKLEWSISRWPSSWLSPWLQCHVHLQSPRQCDNSIAMIGCRLTVTWMAELWTNQISLPDWLVGWFRCAVTTQGELWTNQIAVFLVQVQNLWRGTAARNGRLLGCMASLGRAGQEILQTVLKSPLSHKSSGASPKVSFWLNCKWVACYLFWFLRSPHGIPLWRFLVKCWVGAAI